ncbi:MAG TPA: hypothetical protein VK892_02290 [Pyrinomonadaceae bacterium]|nr:hypothetical protein [Pyrinomonadaceae bacterium]
MNQRQSKDTLFEFNEQVFSYLLKLLKRNMPLTVSRHKLDEDKLWTILLSASVGQTTIEATCQQLKEAVSGNRMREHLVEQFSSCRLSTQQLEAKINQTLRDALPAPVKAELAKRKWETAGDRVEIPYYGKVSEENQFVRRSSAKTGTTHFYCFASLTLINKRRRYTIAIAMVRRGEKMVAVVERLLSQAKQLGVSLKLTWWDKAFAVIEVIRYLRAQAIAYIIALAQRGGSGGIKRLCCGRKSVICQYRFQSAKAGEVETEVAVVCKYSKKRYRRLGVRYFCYAIYGVGQMRVEKVFNKYRRRFVIESSYRQMHQVRARCAMKNVNIRLLLIGLAILIVNIYVLLRTVVVSVNQYGERQRQSKLKLEQMRGELEQLIRQKLGLKQNLYCRNYALYRSFVIY